MKKKLKKEIPTNLRKGTEFFRKEKAITLIALVITIVLNCVCHEKVERLL